MKEQTTKLPPEPWEILPREERCSGEDLEWKMYNYGKGRQTKEFEKYVKDLHKALDSAEFYMALMQESLDHYKDTVEKLDVQHQNRLDNKESEIQRLEVKYDNALDRLVEHQEDSDISKDIIDNLSDEKMYLLQEKDRLETEIEHYKDIVKILQGYNE